MVKCIDLAGHKYGFWDIIKKVGITKSGFALWECKCKCGISKNLNSVSIIHKKAKQHCGCDQDWTNRKFGQLKVIKKVSGLGNHAAKFLCLCDCGIEKVVWGGSLHQGSVISCGCFRARSEEHSCFTIVISCYKQHAKNKGLAFNLERSEFIKLSLSPCVYCGTTKSNMVNRKTKYSGNLTMQYNGIDRIDNAKGYILDNCVSCCKICNYMKRALSLYEWKKHIELICKTMQNQEKSINQPTG